MIPPPAQVLQLCDDGDRWNDQCGLRDELRTIQEGRIHGSFPISTDWRRRVAISFSIGEVQVGGGSLFLIAGPCVIESEAHALKMAEAIASIAEDKKLQAIKLYGEGLSTHDIAREISIAQESVRRVLIAAKVTLRSPMEAISLAMKRKHQCAKPSPIEQPAEMSAAN